MGTYHQMGHDSQNLLAEEDLSGYSGAILSPTNYTRDKIIEQVESHSMPNFEFVFDPQLYFPNSKRGELPKWSYFPSDVDTADHTSKAWWQRVVSRVSEVVSSIPVDAVCSPAVVPRSYSSGYYKLNCQIAMELKNTISQNDIDVLLTVLVRLDDLIEKDRAPEIASIITQVDFGRVFLVLVSDIEPRRELLDTEALKGAMRVISYLEKAGMRTLVGFASSDLILWKQAGATDCATGKFFNLRRFTASRWEEPAGGGGQLPYWFEESMMAFLRESDIIRIRDQYLSSASRRNPYGIRIMSQHETDPGQPWLGLSWRQYMYWFCDLEQRFTQNKIDSKRILKDAEQIWMKLDDADVLMEEPRNNGAWIRSWRRAIVEFRQ